MKSITLLGKMNSEIFKEKLQLANNEDVNFFFTGHSEFDIKLGYKFSIAYSEKEKQIRYDIDAELVCVTQQYMILLDEINKGHRHIIGLLFKPEIPKILQKFPIIENFDTWKERIYIEGFDE